MSTNCLITKLKSSISNEYAPVLGQVQIELRAGALETPQPGVISFGSLTEDIVLSALKGDQPLASYDGTIHYGKTTVVNPFHYRRLHQ